MVAALNDVWVVIGLKVSGLLSCAGSGYIVQDVLRNPNKRSKSIYHRIMVGLSTMDILSSFFFWVLGSWVMPEGSWQWAVGNITTCDIAAFLGMTGWLGSALYHCSLTTYYLLQLKYNWADRRIKNIEKWLHIVPWSISLVYGIVGLTTKSFGPAPAGFCA